MCDPGGGITRTTQNVEFDPKELKAGEETAYINGVPRAMLNGLVWLSSFSFLQGIKWE